MMPAPSIPTCCTSISSSAWKISRRSPGQWKKNSRHKRIPRHAAGMAGYSLVPALLAFSHAQRVRLLHGGGGTLGVPLWGVDRGHRLGGGDRGRALGDGRARHLKRLVVAFD